jgi:hypothetical protein
MGDLAIPLPSEHWRIPEKIRAAQLNGTYENIIHHPG